MHSLFLYDTPMIKNRNTVSSNYRVRYLTKQIKILNRFLLAMTIHCLIAETDTKCTIVENSRAHNSILPTFKLIHSRRTH